jgi:CDP-glucose 4,6-dehydratase
LKAAIEKRFEPDPEFWSGRRVLVTGHTGFKGGWLTLWLASLGARVSGFSLAPDASPNFFEAVALAEVCDHLTGDIRDEAMVTQCFSITRPEIVFHLAAQSLVRRSYLEPQSTVATNVLGTTHILEACRLSGSVKTVLIITSDKVYQNRGTIEAYREDDRLGGHDVYSASKACAELISASYRQSFFAVTPTRSIACCTARAGNVFGGGDWAENRLIPDLARAFCIGKAASIRAPNSIRPWQHVLDVTRGYIMLARALSEPGFACPASFNFGPDPQQRITVAQISDWFVKAWGDGHSWNHSPESDGPHEAQLLTVDSNLARRTLGWRPRLSFPQSLEMTATWYRSHQEDSDARRMRELSLAQISVL